MMGSPKVQTVVAQFQSKLLYITIHGTELYPLIRGRAE